MKRTRTSKQILTSSREKLEWIIEELEFIYKLKYNLNNDYIDDSNDWKINILREEYRTVLMSSKLRLETKLEIYNRPIELESEYLKQWETTTKK